MTSSTKFNEQLARVLEETKRHQDALEELAKKRRKIISDERLAKRKQERRERDAYAKALGAALIDIFYPADIETIKNRLAGMHEKGDI